jgi:hypothetical protein
MAASCCSDERLRYAEGSAKDTVAGRVVGRRWLYLLGSSIVADEDEEEEEAGKWK